MGTVAVGDRLDRALHVIDADNLLGDPATTDASYIAAVFDAYRDAAGYRCGDHVVVGTGCNGSHVLAVELAWPQARHRRRPGHDGADLVLLDEVRWAAASGRYSRVVIGSGDRIFLEALDVLRSADVPVRFVARGRSVASALRVRAGRDLRILPLASGAVAA